MQRRFTGQGEGEGDPQDLVFFFVHVMKTGGTTFNNHLLANFDPEACYPLHPSGQERRLQYGYVEQLLELTSEQRARVRLYQGHLPFYATQLVEVDVTLTILRHPVDRVVSFLRQCKRQPAHDGMELDAIYEDPWMQPLYMRDYQAKLFAMTVEDSPSSHMAHIEVDDQRLRTAVGQLEQVDVLGLTERFDDFLGEVERRFGWRIESRPSERVSSEGWDASAALRRRIEDDNAADMAFYERAKELQAERRTR